MVLFIFLTVVQAVIAASLVGVILMQRSEGGGLGVGGSPSGFMSARGAADFLTRATAVLATVFVVLSIVLAAMAVESGSGRQIDTSLERGAPAALPQIPDPLAGAGPPVVGQPVVDPMAPTPPSQAPAEDDPLAGATKR